MVHAIAIFILIKTYFGLLISNNQMDRNHVNHSNPFLKVCFTWGYIISTNFINFVKKNCKYSWSMNKCVRENQVSLEKKILKKSIFTSRITRILP